MSPIFSSPMVDFGYDISDFYDIHYEYGVMADFEELVLKAHALGKYFPYFRANLSASFQSIFIFCQDQFKSI